MGAHRIGLGVVVVALCARVAGAEPDNRPGDRFFFGIYGGSTDGGSGGGYEVSAWPNDYMGIMAGLSIATAGPTSETPNSTTFEWGGAFVGAVPLRYVQPYAGGYVGFARSALGGWEGEGTGFHTDLHPVVGVNGYVSRNLRLYVQWRPVTIHRDMEGVDDPTTDFYTVGLRWSPDAFHRARSIKKVDLVWGSVTFSCLVWLFINLSQHNAHGNASSMTPTPPGNGMQP